MPSNCCAVVIHLTLQYNYLVFFLSKRNENFFCDYVVLTCFYILFCNDIFSSTFFYIYTSYIDKSCQFMDHLTKCVSKTLCWYVNSKLIYFGGLACIPLTCIFDFCFAKMCAQTKPWIC